MPSAHHHKHHLHAMLAWFPLLFFFAVLMGSPVPAFLVFTLIGFGYAWHKWRHPQVAGVFQWTREDSGLALCFISIPLFKLLSMMWSAQPAVAAENALWHGYYFFWPFVLIGLSRCQPNQQTADRAIALGLIAAAVWRSAFQITQWPWLSPGTANVGILAQLIMTVGAWNVLALTRPDPNLSSGWRGVYALGLLATLVLLVLSTRRLELLGFAFIAAAILIWRARQSLTRWRLLIGGVLFLGLLALLMYLRWEKFALGFEEIAQYRMHGARSENFASSSWGIRLELWRVSLAAFLDHPWTGLSASARPFNMQEWGGPPAELFSHRHFHSHLMQTLVEGGLLGLGVLLLTLGLSTWMMVVKPWKTQPEVALLGAALLAAYVVEGSASATLHYDKANALLVILSCWVWLQVKKAA